MDPLLKRQEGSRIIIHVWRAICQILLAQHDNILFSEREEDIFSLFLMKQDNRVFL